MRMVGGARKRGQFSPTESESGCTPIPAVSSRRVGSSILASLSEAGGDALLRLASKPLPPRSPSSAKRHLECTRALLLQITRQSSRLPTHAQAFSTQCLPNHSQLKQSFSNSKRVRHSSTQSRLGKSPLSPVAI